MAEQRPTLHPERVRAVITTPWTGTGYKPVTVRSIESFYIESNMDQDADNFEIVVGDPRNHLSSLMYRDGEIRIQLFGIGLDIDYLLTGIVDDVTHNDDGRYTLTGRDRSAIAVDTIAEPGKWLEQRANEFIEREARKLGVTSKFSLAEGPVYKTVRTDGSETSWELWYRLIRKEQQWLWFTSDGRLVSSKLGYNAPPSYFFGSPPPHSSNSQAKQWIPVEQIAFRKTTQTRVGKVVLFYKDRNDRVLSEFDSDPTTAEWEKRPTKYAEDTKISTKPAAKKAIWEEIFESKVGALEIKVTIPDIGIIIRTNRMARLRVPEIDLAGDWFIVGTRIIASEDGYVQEVRLREKGYGLTRRIPTDPEVSKPPSSNEEDVGECIDLASIPNVRWSQYFVNAAHKWQENVPYDLYLATLFAICDQETGFRNVTVSGKVEWFKWDGKPQSGITTEAEWRETFKNESPIRAVGPMQLYTQSYKETADRFGGGKVDEFYGNRWLPEANIMTAAQVLSGKGAKSEGTLWAGVGAYYGSGPEVPAYVESVKRKVYDSPGYLKMVQDAISSCNESGKFTGDEEFPDQDAIAAAKELLAWKKKGWFDSNNASVISDIELTAAGKGVANPCGGKPMPIKAKPLNATLFLLRNGFSVMMSSLCSSHPCLTDNGGVSKHSVGLACDLGAFGKGKGDFNYIGDGKKETRSLIISVMTAYKSLTIEGGRPNQTICNGYISCGQCCGTEDKVIQSLQLSNYEPDDYITGCHFDHLHVGY